MSKITLAGSLCLFSIMVSSGAYALNETTHEVVNRVAARQSSLRTTLQDQLNIADGLTARFRGSTVLDIFGMGGVREDNGLRFFRHFHDPLKMWRDAGLDFFGEYESSIHWMQKPADCPTLSLSNPNEWTWSASRCYLDRALSSATPDDRERAWANTFRAIGQMMHLVVDASVPEHTRNDPHPLGGIFGSYEYWVQKQHGERGSTQEDAFVLKYLSAPRSPDAALVDQPTGDAAAPVPIARLIDSDVYLGTDPNVTLTSAIGIAEVANANFFSEDTGYRRWLSPNYPYPSVERLQRSGQQLTVGQGIRRYYKKGDGDGLAVDPVLAECAMDAAFRDDFIPTPQYKCVDQNVWEQTALNMLPRAVGYASALIDYFFRGTLGVEYQDQTLQIWGSKETMVGDVQLLYDNTDGIRRVITSWAGLRLEPDQSSPAFTKPQLPADAASGAPCWLVFRGQLGLEAGAVVGSQIPCPTDSSSPSPPPPQRGTWAEYSCIYGPYAPPGSPDVRYHYATPDPVIEIDGAPVVRFFVHPASGETTCSLVTWGLPSQPLNSVTSHPF